MLRALILFIFTIGFFPLLVIIVFFKELLNFLLLYYNSSQTLQYSISPNFYKISQTRKHINSNFKIKEFFSICKGTAYGFMF